LEAIAWKHSIDSLKKTAILGTSHIIRKVLQCETWSLSGGDHPWFKRSTRKKRPVTRDDNNNNSIIVIILVVSFMLGIYNYKAELNHVYRVYIVAATM
jgi:hypothetical protein